MTTDDASHVAAFLVEAGHLKRTKRSGWWIVGIRDPESVAEHSFRTAIIGYVLATLEGADPERTAALCLFHDLAETRLGDVPSIGKSFVTTAPAEEVTKAQTAALPAVVAQSVREVVAEFEAKQTLEARCAKDADKLECLLQAREYRTQGYVLAQPWVDTMLAAVRTESARQLAQAAATMSVDAWWHDIVASYGVRPAAPVEG